MSTAYVNGRYVPFAEAALPLNDAGVMWGAIITDRLRTYRGRPFRLDDHLVRFRQSCALARVPLPASDATLTSVAEELVTRDFAGHDLSIVYVATPGPIPGVAPTLIVHTVPVSTDRIINLQRRGAVLVPHSASLGVDPRVKHRSRLPWWTASQAVHSEDSHAVPLFIHPTSGAILETATANLLAMYDGVLTTPPREIILPGVSLHTTLELAAELGMPTAERPFKVAELGRASEVVLTNSTFGIAPVARVSGDRFPISGPVLTLLRTAWSRLVGVEIGPPG